MPDNCPTLYDLHCKDEFTEIKADIHIIKKALLGNGDIGLVTKVDRNTRWIGLMSWVYGAIFTGVFLSIGVAYIISRIK